MDAVINDSSQRDPGKEPVFLHLPDHCIMVRLGEYHVRCVYHDTPPLVISDPSVITAARLKEEWGSAGDRMGGRPVPAA